MKPRKFRSLLFLTLAFLTPAIGCTVDVTNSSQVTLGSGDDLIFYLAVNYGQKSAYPAELEMVLGGLPVGGVTDPIPGTSGVYVPGMLFNGTLESQNGSAAMALTDPNASRLGLPSGDMLLTPGARSGGAYTGAVDLLSAGATIDAAQGASFFNSGEVEIDLHNSGSAITVGYPGTTLANDFSASWISWTVRRAQARESSAWNACIRRNPRQSLSCSLAFPLSR